MVNIAPFHVETSTANRVRSERERACTDRYSAVSLSHWPHFPNTACRLQ